MADVFISYRNTPSAHATLATGCLARASRADLSSARLHQLWFYLTLVKGFFPQGTKATPVLIPIDSAAAIADANRAFESFDVPAGTLRGSPPVPDDDLTTLRTSLYLVARKSLSADVATNLTQSILKERRELLRENPLFAQITAPSIEADAYLPVHPGALAVYNGTTQSFIDEYSNYIYIGPMILAGRLEVFGRRATRIPGRPPRYTLWHCAADTRRQFRGRAFKYRGRDSESRKPQGRCGR